MTSFSGQAIAKMDDKGRVVLPSQIRNAVPPSDGAPPLVMAYGLPGARHLRLYTRQGIEARRQQVESIRGKSDEKRKLKLFYFAYTVDVDVDSAGRILIDKNGRGRLKSAARDQVVFCGLGEYVEVWSPAGYEDEYGVPFEAEDVPGDVDAFADVDPDGLLEDILDAQTAGRD